MGVTLKENGEEQKGKQEGKKAHEPRNKKEKKRRSKSKSKRKSKSKSSDKCQGSNDISSIDERYGSIIDVEELPSEDTEIDIEFIPESVELQTEMAADDVVKETKTTMNSVAAEEMNVPMENLLQFVAGMPTMKSIEKMTGGLKMWKMGKHEHFKNALNQLNKYQKLMEKSRTYDYSKEEVKNRREANWRSGTTDTYFEQKELDAAFDALVGFIVEANQAVDEVMNDRDEMYKSSNVRKLTPVFSSLITQANGLLPKLAYLENVIAPYIIETDKETFTYAEVINHQVAGGRSGGIAMRGIHEGYSSIDFGPRGILDCVNKETRDARKQELLKLRKEKTEQARMNLQIPKMPIGALAENNNNTVKEGKPKELKERAEAMADAYIAECRQLMIALEDVKESHEGTGGTERIHVHDRQAMQFQLARLLYRASQSRDLLAKAILSGIPEEGEEAAKYKDLRMLSEIGGCSLGNASDTLNKDAQNSENFVRLVDSEGKDLKENKDYKIGGGNASISILDKVNNKVLRAPKKSSQYLSEEQQKTALNGIYDEAVAKVSQFLGLDVAADAEVRGFMAKEQGSNKETPIYGGSVMELVKGRDAKSYKFRMNESQMKLDGNRKDDNSPKLNLSENEKILGDMMKLNVLDYIVMHGDRNSGNFMVTPEAQGGESAITAIDNDMVFGVNTSGREIGHEKSANALQSINNRVIMEFGFTLEGAFPNKMMTSEVKQILDRIDLDGLNQLLIPYTDRVSRLAAVHRASELKQLAENAIIVDLSDANERQKYVKELMKATAKEITRTLSSEKKKFCQKILPNTLVRTMLLDDIQLGKSCLGINNVKDLLFYFKVFDVFTKDEMKEIFLKNVSIDTNTDEPMSEEMFNNSMYAEILKDYDLPLNDLSMKYYKRKIADEV